MSQLFFRYGKEYARTISRPLLVLCVSVTALIEPGDNKDEATEEEEEIETALQGKTYEPVIRSNLKFAAHIFT